MSSQIEAKVPDIGNYHDVPVIELLVRPGDVVKKDQGLVTLESDKATMEVPAPVAGVVKALQVKLDDKVSEGAVIALIEAAEAGGGKAVPASPPASGAAPGSAAPAAAAVAELRPSRHRRRSGGALHGIPGARAG